MIEKEFSTYSEIKKFCKMLPYNFLYRGTKTNFLTPKLITDKFFTYKEYERVEEKMNCIFRRHYPNLVTERNRVKRNWEYRMIAREHGLCNRLIDWTNDLTTAIDFATSKPDEVTEEFI